MVEPKDLTYGGKYYSIVIEILTKFFSKLIDQIEYVLPNCTLCVFSLAKINGLPLPANSMPNANKLHTVVANGWEAIKYTSGMTLLPNDIVEWGCNHVAYIIEKGVNPQLYASWWTNYDGTSKNYRRDFGITSTVKDTIEYLYSRYVNRFFHKTSFEDECNRGGGKAKPSYVIRYKNPIVPSIDCVDEDKTVNQVYVSSNTQNMRKEPNGEKVGVSQIGYYNVLKIDDEQEDYVWYEVKDNIWIAGVDGRVKFIPKTQEQKVDIDDLIEESRNKLQKAKELAKEIIGL